MCERIYTTQEQTIIKNFKFNHSHVCEYCGKQIIGKEIVTVDHKIPVCRGGETIEENLVISCLNCNQDKDDMTTEEYIIYKQKEKEILNNYEANNCIDELLILHSGILKRIQEVTDEISKIDKKILKIQQDMMWNNFNACEGYLLTKKLSNLLLEREELRIKKIGFNQLEGVLGKQRKEIADVKSKIPREVRNANRVYLKRYAMKNCKIKTKSNVIQMNEYMEAAR